jgi:hypothetical protein
MMQRLLARKPAPGPAGPVRTPSALRISKPGDTLEREADRVADAVLSGRRAPSWSIAKVGAGAVQRDTPDDPGQPQPQEPKPNNYDEAGKKILEAAMKTDAGKKVIEKVEKDPLVKNVKDFVTSTPGMIITGTAAAGVVAGLTAAHKPLPMQIPAVPVDGVIPALKGVKAQINVQGPLNHPTQFTIGFSGTFGGGGSEKKKKDDTSEKIARDKEALKASMDLFKPKGQGASDDVGELLKLGRGAATPGFGMEDFGKRSPFPALPGTQGTPLAPAQQANQQAAGRPSDAPLASPPGMDTPEKKEEQVPVQRKEDLNAPSLQRKCSCGGNAHAGGECEECGQKQQLQRKGSEPVSASAPSSVEKVLQTAGTPLDRESRSFFESRFGVDFSKVRIHTGAEAANSAADVAAKAYTVGNSIAFGNGQFSPHTQEGRRLLAHELTHVVQQNGGGRAVAKSPPAVQRKVILTHAEMKDKERRDFLTARARDWGSHQHLAAQIMHEMAAAGDSFDFEDDDELKTEIVKRISTVAHMKESQQEVGKVPGHLKKAFGYPFSTSAPGDVYGPRVNFDAKDYWTPGVPDDYAPRTDTAKNKLARSKPRSDRHTVYGDQPMDTYFWKLTDQGKADPYTAIKKLFDPQPLHKRTLFHCDYLISVVNLMSLADAIGKDEFNKRIAAYGVDKIVLNWNLFEDLDLSTRLRDTKGEFTKTEVPGLGSMQRVTPGTEKDLVLGDHVVFSNHIAYDPMNVGPGYPWKLENAVFIGTNGGKRGNEKVYLGHGSGRLTGSQMKHKLASEFNAVVDLVTPWTTKAQSHNAGKVAEAEQTLKDRFNVHRVGKEFHVQGKDGMNCKQDVDFNVRRIGDDEVPGLHDPCNPTKMYPVERPIESAPGKATP